MTEPLFRGVGVALATLFTDELEIDPEATAAHAARVVELGVAAVVVAGSTGEAAALTPEERVDLLRNVRAAVPAGVPVLAGTGAPSTRQAVALTEAACDHGADGVLVLSPPGVADPRAYYEAVVEATTGVPVLAYHYPTASSPGIDIDLLDELTVAGLKDSSGDPDRMLEELDLFPGHLYTGSSAVLSLAGPLGCTGAILALANVEPERCIRAFGGDAEAQKELAPFHLAARRGFPVALKNLMAERFATSTAARMGG